MQIAKRKCRGHYYTEKVKKIALTVHFYSQKAYSYIHKIFSLPHQSSIRHCFNNQIFSRPYWASVCLYSGNRGGGFNNNPNTLQLEYALRNILMKNSITASQKANVMSFENESTGSLFSLKWSKHRSTILEEAGDSGSDDAQLQELSDALNRVSYQTYQKICCSTLQGSLYKSWEDKLTVLFALKHCC